ncbi:pentapeptide repeat-containing protein [Nocardia sp. NBC_00508]|uniref:pentapeptide repeat-containing protein n=1 Tax=Nocardia sp. NBC_00508 TaxID=2975992 RepID=UPI002E81B27A|nr:pentapeptide repeat-containing protein [Nocardia sp. NBC_00508]WUD65465.1 pentapeptide repeat-containing protein [Nocardia sp. NBC_00508]
MTTTVAAIAALWFTSQSLRATDNQYALSQQVAVTNRFQTAIEQLTSDKVDIRLGGIYLLERLAKDSPADHETVFTVLSAFLRTHTTASACEPPTRTAPAPVDAYAVVKVIGRRDNARPLDLAGTCLAGMRFFQPARYDARDRPRYANLTGSSFDSANLADTIFYFANLTDAYFGDANLTGAGFSYANLTGAYLVNANLTEAILQGANFTDANLDGANLTGAYLAGANFTNIFYSDTTRWPGGFTPPKSRPNPLL